MVCSLCGLGHHPSVPCPTNQNINLVNLNPPPPIQNAPDHPSRHANNTAFIQNSFALNDRSTRHELRTILSQDWWFLDTVEPQGSLDPLIMRQGALFACKFLSCGHKRFARFDRVKAHIRWHLAFRPFRCSGVPVTQNDLGCGTVGCNRRFLSQEYLRAHAERTKVICDICNSMVDRKNMARHKRRDRKSVV